MTGWRRRSPPTPTTSSTSGRPRTITILRPTLEKIEATLLLINAADDERNPPETGVTDAALKRVKNGRLFLIPASSETRGHLTTGNATFYKKQLQELLQTAPQQGDVEPGRSERAMSSSRFRRAALALPGAIEGAHQGTPISVSENASSPRSAIPMMTGAWSS